MSARTVVLAVLTGLCLVLTIRQAQRRRRQLLAQNRKTESRRLAETSVTTTMLVAVVGVFLLVELPLAGLEIVLMVDNTASLGLLDARRRDMYEQLVNLFILLSYPINFFIYCAMSRQFRDTFRRLFTREGHVATRHLSAGHLPPGHLPTPSTHAPT